MAVAGEQVAELIEMLSAKLKDIEAKIEADQFKKDQLQRNLIKHTDDLEDLDALLVKQRKLYKQYNMNLDETENALKALGESAKKFTATFKVIAKKD